MGVKGGGLSGTSHPSSSPQVAVTTWVSFQSQRGFCLWLCS